MICATPMVGAYGLRRCNWPSASSLAAIDSAVWCTSSLTRRCQSLGDLPSCGFWCGSNGALGGLDCARDPNKHWGMSTADTLRDLKARWDRVSAHTFYGGLLLAGALALLGAAIGLVRGWFDRLPQWLVEAPQVPRWESLALGTIVVAAGLWALAMGRRSARLAAQLAQIRAAATTTKKQKPPPSPLLNYREDIFEGVRWRWRYTYDRLDMPDDITASCPNCDLDMAPQRLGIGYTGFVCRDCKKEVAAIHHPDDSTVYGRVENLIGRELRRKGAVA